MTWIWNWLVHSNQAYLRATEDDIPESIGGNENDDSSAESDHDSTN